METSKPLTEGQLNKLKETVRKRFDDLFQRIGSNRQKLSATVFNVDQTINKMLTKEKIDSKKEKEILNLISKTERAANEQLPHQNKSAAKPVAASGKK